MDIRIRSSRPEDAMELAKIDSLCSQGENIIFHSQHDDFFKRSRMYKKWVIFVAEAGNVIVGMVGACIKNLKVTQKSVSTGYIYDLKVHPRWRRKGIAYLLLKQIDNYLRSEKVAYAYTHVLGANFIVKKICNTMGMYYCGEFKALLFPCSPHNAPEVQLVTGTELKKILPVIESDLFHYDLRENKPVSVQYKKSTPGSPFIGTFSLLNSLHTTAGVWNSSIHSSKVLDRKPFVIRFLNKMGAKIIKKFKIPRFPKIGEKLSIYYLFDIRQKSHNPEMLFDFIRGMQKLLHTQGVHMLMIHLDIRDPLYKDLNSWAFASISGRILMRTPINGELPPLLHCLYLDVRDF